MPNPYGRNPIPIDWQRANYLLQAGCTGVEIAAHFGMHPETFYDRVKQKFGIAFSEYAAIKRSEGDMMLKEAQFDVAYKDKDKVMLVWLGKNRLGQKDTHDIKHSEIKITRVDPSEPCNNNSQPDNPL